MIVVVWFVIVLFILAIPSDFALNKLVLLSILFMMVLVMHYEKQKPWYYRFTEWLLFASMFVVWSAGFLTPHYFLLQPIINIALLFHVTSIAYRYYPTDEFLRRRTSRVLIWAVPLFFIAIWAQFNVKRWLKTVQVKEKYLPPIIVPSEVEVQITPELGKKVNVYDSLAKPYIRPGKINSTP